MVKRYERDGVVYSASNHRMCYDPEFHENHGKAWSQNDLIYLCKSWDGMKKADIALALGRTHATILQKAYELRKNGDFDKFKEMEES